MVSKFVAALNQGKIFAVDWQNIQEMLGEELDRKITCSICENSEAFPPVQQRTCELSEEDVTEVLRQVRVGWMAHDYIGDSPLSRFKTRYFSVDKPMSDGHWLENPNS